MAFIFIKNLSKFIEHSTSAMYMKIPIPVRFFSALKQCVINR